MGSWAGGAVAIFCDPVGSADYDRAMGEYGAECPACGGSGGGPFGRPGSAWDVESYVCPRCEGLGIVRDHVASARPLAKAADQATDSVRRGPGLSETQPTAGQTKLRSSA
jgi:hypothetical protein